MKPFARLKPSQQRCGTARLKDEAEKLRVLKSLVQEGLDDVASGRVVDWNVTEFLAEMEDEERSEPRIAQR
jgi:hypothetical protein